MRRYSLATELKTMANIVRHLAERGPAVLRARWRTMFAIVFSSVAREYRRMAALLLLGC